MQTAAIVLMLLAADPTEIRGRVVSIADGDTITVLVNREQIRVRLAGIDAPEKAQPFGTKAKEALAALVFEKDVRVVAAGRDRYGRTLGVVWVGETNVNDEQVRLGFAWQYRQYDKTERLAKLEAGAREAKAGLWANKDQVPPWEWRREQKGK